MKYCSLAKLKDNQSKRNDVNIKVFILQARSIFHHVPPTQQAFILNNFQSVSAMHSTNYFVPMGFITSYKTSTEITLNQTTNLEATTNL